MDVTDPFNSSPLFKVSFKVCFLLPCQFPILCLDTKLNAALRVQKEKTNGHGRHPKHTVLFLVPFIKNNNIRFVQFSFTCILCDKTNIVIYDIHCSKQTNYFEVKIGLEEPCQFDIGVISVEFSLSIRLYPGSVELRNVVW